MYASLMSTVDLESAMANQRNLRSHSFTAWELRDIRTIRKHQQEAYSASIRRGRS